MPKVTMTDVNQLVAAVDAKLQAIVNSCKHPDYFSIEDAKDMLSEPECVGSIAEKAYVKMNEFFATCNSSNCEKDVLDNLELYSWYKIYNDWPETELKDEILKNLNF